MYKKFLSSLLIIAVLCVAVALPASASTLANTGDTYYEFYWKDNNSRYDYTTVRQKGDNTPVYLCAQLYTLPYNGFWAKTFQGTTSGSVGAAASKDEYLVNDYEGHTIRSNALEGVNMAGRHVKIRGHYRDTTYSWGSCEIAWSPDTYNASQYSSLN